MTAADAVPSRGVASANDTLAVRDRALVQVRGGRWVAASRSSDCRSEKVEVVVVHAGLASFDGVVSRGRNVVELSAGSDRGKGAADLAAYGRLGAPEQRRDLGVGQVLVEAQDHRGALSRREAPYDVAHGVGGGERRGRVGDHPVRWSVGQRLATPHPAPARDVLVDDDLAHVGVGRLHARHPAPGGVRLAERRLRQVLGVAVVAGQQIGRPGQRMPSRRDVLLEGPAHRRHTRLNAPAPETLRQPGRKLSRTVRTGLSTLRSTSATDCQVPSASAPRITGRRRVRRDDGREDVGAAVAARPVAVLPAVVGGQQVAQRREQVVVGAGVQLEDGDADGRVRDEDVEQPVTAAVGGEPAALAGDVEHDLVAPGRHREGRSLHIALSRSTGLTVRRPGMGRSHDVRRGPKVTPRRLRWSM